MPIKKENQLSIVDSVQNRVTALEKDGTVHFPEKYSPGNALKSAMLILQETTDKNGNAVLDTCSRQSIANTLLDMVVQGLSPAKKQCYFIPYGKQLQLSRSYFGTIAVAKRVAGIQEVNAQVVYKEDKFRHKIDVETGVKTIEEHIQPFENYDSQIIGAYAVVIFGDGRKYCELMSKKQIVSAWQQGKAKGNSPAHKNFPEEMAKKTVINRALKIALNSSDDSDVVIGAVNRSTETEYQKSDISDDMEAVQQEQQETMQEVDFGTEPDDNTDSEESGPKEAPSEQETVKSGVGDVPGF